VSEERTTAEASDRSDAGGPGEPAGVDADLGPRAVTYPYRRIERPPATVHEGPDPYGEPDPEWLRIDWQQHLRRIEVDGTEVNYVELGEGRPIVFVHGLSGCWQNWLENLPYFAARGYRAVALDLPGFGHSPMPKWEISIPAYGRLVDGLCRELNLHSTALVGNSMGGFIAAEVAVNEPQWTSHLVLVSAAGISHARMRREPVVASGRVMAAFGPLALRMREVGLRRPRIRRRAFTGVVRHPDRIRRELLAEIFINGVATPGFLASLGALTGYDIVDRLERVRDPTLIVWGRDDLVVPASDAAGYAERIPGSELHVFADCGHLPMAERPVRFNRLVERFLDSRDPGSPS
jgi:pimeloyl-ACP methyl ester carboxylesterase